jgi:hypothetical protein
MLEIRGPIDRNGVLQIGELGDFKRSRQDRLPCLLNFSPSRCARFVALASLSLSLSLSRSPYCFLSTSFPLALLRELLFARIDYFSSIILANPEISHFFTVQ